MLILSRAEGEAVFVFEQDGQRRCIRVVGVRGNRVRLAFDYPKDVGIWREELTQAMEPQENYTDAAT